MGLKGPRFSHAHVLVVRLCLLLQVKLFKEHLFLQDRFMIL